MMAIWRALEATVALEVGGLGVEHAIEVALKLAHHQS